MAHAEIDAGDHAHQQDHDRKNRTSVLAASAALAKAVKYRTPHPQIANKQQTDRSLHGENHREEIPPAGLAPLPEQIRYRWPTALWRKRSSTPIIASVNGSGVAMTAFHAPFSKRPCCSGCCRSRDAFRKRSPVD